MFLRSIKNVVSQTLQSVTQVARTTTPISNSSVNAAQFSIPRRLSTTSITTKLKAEDKIFNISEGCLAVGAIIGGICGGLGNASDAPLLCKPFAFGLGFIWGGFIGGIFGGVSGAAVALPIVLATEFPIAGAVVATGVIVNSGYKHRDQLFGTKQTTQQVSDTCEPTANKGIRKGSS